MLGAGSGRPRTLRLSPTERRDQILDAANTLFAERGYEGASVEDIATSAGVTRGLVHHYFGGRKEVYLALLERIGAGREEQLRPPVGRTARARVQDSVSRWRNGPRRTERSTSARSHPARTSPIRMCGGRLLAPWRDA